MKNQPVFSSSGTIEDLVFENRNRAYGAYEMNRKCRKYLIIAFFISLLGVSSAIAVPFIKALKDGGTFIGLSPDVTAVLSDVRNDVEPPEVPLPPPPPTTIVKQAVYAPPVIVEEAAEEIPFVTNEELKRTIVNIPIDVQIEPVKEEFKEITKDPEETILFPEEQASFMGGNINEFRTWVLNNIIYPPIAIENGIFGKVTVQFCVNSKGEVVDIKFVRSIDPSVDNEVLRVISSAPIWTPARQGGRPVKQLFTLPIVFQMQ